MHANKQANWFGDDFTEVVILLQGAQPPKPPTVGLFLYGGSFFIPPPLNSPWWG